MLGTIAFAVIAFMLTAYVLLDGYDLGIAAVVPLIARGDRERALAMASIGPFWNGNEVWLIAAGGALFALFPAAYASSFSGFYLPFVVVLWLLMFRGIAMELRNHLDSHLWREFWDTAFWLSSSLLIVLLGVALGNLLRGVPLDARGYFLGTFSFLLNPYALLVAALALATLSQHGAAFAALRIEGAPAQRAVRVGLGAWWVVLALYLAASAATFAVRGAPSALWLYLVPLVSLGTLIWLRVALLHARARAAFAASSLFVASLLLEAAGTLYPYLLPAFPAGHGGGITVESAAPSALALTVGLTVTIAGSVVALVYGSAVWRRMAGKVGLE
ncbi:MAG: cytochrome d ubiquinol oxidase subunit II [Candidatus Eremiobacteraeota bacterium]|nr:cytochrome d ubiquinol oxidase subunit II [Candidatus Eremiobacteraeota bacterium]